MGLIERQAVDRAFRSGLLTDPDVRASGLADDGDLGPGELAVLTTKRMAGLATAESAFETGRTLRVIARLFDRAGAPPRVAEQFRDNLAAAVMGESMRKHSNWSREDTIDMFMDMYERILQASEEELAKARKFLDNQATKPAPRRGAGLRQRLGGWLGKAEAA